MLKSREFYELLELFEKSITGKHRRKDRESAEFWKLRRYYESGETNTAFCAFFDGYMLAKSIYRE